ncbi:hypothetical protein BJX68DRAFT_265619 [Aspergillus pseudodeflectus]|uniref:Uncharacterized protein n=1 Tax=Aspergillus pseudodeflectus TaxID=176178 RepID=A0ABR4KKD7_9EURO
MTMRPQFTHSWRPTVPISTLLKGHESLRRIRVSTVDGLQGEESMIVIFDLTAAQKSAFVGRENPQAPIKPIQLLLKTDRQYHYCGPQRKPGDVDANKKRDRDSADSVATGKENIQTVFNYARPAQKAPGGHSVDNSDDEDFEPNPLDNEDDDDEGCDECFPGSDDIDSELLGVPATDSIVAYAPHGIKQDAQPSQVAVGDGDGEDYGECIPGPDGFDTELFDVAVTDSIVAYVPRDIDPHASNRFAQKRHVMITHMATWSKTNDLRRLGYEERPMTLGLGRILGNLSVTDIVSLFISGIPTEVQNLFDKPVLTAQDLLNLPDT